MTRFLGCWAPHHRNGGLIRLMEPGSEWVRIIAVLFSAGHKVSVWGAVWTPGLIYSQAVKVRPKEGQISAFLFLESEPGAAPRHTQHWQLRAAIIYFPSLCVRSSKLRWNFKLPMIEIIRMQMVTAASSRRCITLPLHSHYHLNYIPFWCILYQQELSWTVGLRLERDLDCGEWISQWYFW